MPRHAMLCCAVLGIHYVTVKDASAVPAMVRWLQANDSIA